jgi:hypothetical protein
MHLSSEAEGEKKAAEDDYTKQKLRSQCKGSSMPRSLLYQDEAMGFWLEKKQPIRLTAFSKRTAPAFPLPSPYY